ncbi:hypothetical protein R1sor_021661 [Riccia sorocarpa]|uniref:Uncharacterized protein n=1 Tax=Riccia sorocarpa TaxID=122646 RepID=A0ABD3GHN6_9MARC
MNSQSRESSVTEESSAAKENTAYSHSGGSQIPCQSGPSASGPSNTQSKSGGESQDDQEIFQPSAQQSLEPRIRREKSKPPEKRYQKTAKQLARELLRQSIRGSEERR